MSGIQPGGGSRCIALALGLLTLAVVHVAARPALDFDNGLTMELVERSGWFLGIGEVAIDGVPLRPSSPCVFPLVAADWSYPNGLYTRLRLADVREIPGGWELEIELREEPSAAGWERFFPLDADGNLMRDEFFLARTGNPPAEKASAAWRPEMAARNSAAPVAGRLLWRIEAVDETIAGWPWRGWRWSFSGELAGGIPLNAFRLVSGWAAGGSIDGLTLASQRYRGLGLPAQELEDKGQGSTGAWSTQDLLVPDGWAGRSASMDRTTALELRATSSIHAPARGAGTGFIDYQYRPRGGLAAFPERQGNLRALTEIYPGDRLPAQVDEEHFAAAMAWRTIPQRYLFLATGDDKPGSFWQNRYLELEQRVRSAVAAELGFVETPVVPTLGALFDFWRPGDGFAQVVARLGAHAGPWSGMGVRRIMVHNPGWKNGRAAKFAWDGATRDEFVGGSVNTVYDWWPLPDVESAWRETHAALRTLGIDYYVWITGMTHRDAGFHRLVGDNPAFWASNTPDGRPSPIYGEEMLKHNILSPAFAEAFDARLSGVRHAFGYEGFWGDSFHNLFMSQFDWRTRGGEPQQRAWWEWLAARTREGIGWISESQSFPGLGCSIETDGWDLHPWLLGHTIKWLRGTAQFQRNPVQWLPVAYRLMAFNSWLAPEVWVYEVNRETQPDTVIAEFGRLGNELLAARPYMTRPYVLPEGRGVLWLPAQTSAHGVLFSFANGPLPEGVSGRPILETAQPDLTLQREWRTIAVTGDDLFAAFGIERAPLPDARGGARQIDPSPCAGPVHAPVLTYNAVPGRHQETAWNDTSPIWKAAPEADPVAWPQEGGFRAFFPAGRRVVLPLQGTQRVDGVQTVTPGVEFVIDTVREGEPGDALVLSGPLLGPAKVHFKGSLRDPSGSPHMQARREVGLQFRGGGVYDLEADLLAWPGQRHLHSQVVGLDDPGTTVHFRGFWDATGELCRPGLVLGDGTRFVVWPEAHLQFIKDYGGFTLQLWVTGTGSQGGTLELHPGFVADRSREKVSAINPRASDLVADALGCIRMGGATLITHNSRNLPVTGRAMGDAADSIQNNGHLVFEHRDTNRWIVRTRDQLYRGAVWVDHDVALVTERNLILEGVTEPADAVYHYTAANAFQTRRAKDSPAVITIRKQGPAALVLRGEQAYVEGSLMVVEEGTVAFHTDPAAGGMYPDGKPKDSACLDLRIGPRGVVEWSAPQARIRSLESAPGSVARWTSPTLVIVSGPVTFGSAPEWAGPPPATEVVLVQAPSIQLASASLPTGWTIQSTAAGAHLVYNPAFQP